MAGPASADGRIAAVRLTCEGVSEHTNPLYREFTAYHIMPDESIFTEGEVSELSQLVGMPLLVRKLRPSPTPPTPQLRHSRSDGAFKSRKPGFSSNPGANYYGNPTATYLMSRCFPSDTSHDTTPLLETPTAWIKNVGTVLIARRDGKDLYSSHVVILLSYFWNARETYGYKSKEDIVQLLTPAGFREYYDKFMAALAIEPETSDLDVTMEDGENDGVIQQHPWFSLPPPFEV